MKRKRNPKNKPGGAAARTSRHRPLPCPHCSLVVNSATRMFDDGEPTNLDDGTCLTVCINCMGLSKYTSAGLVKVTMEEYEAFPAETKEELSRLKGVLFLTRVKDPRDFVAEQRRNASQQ